MKATLGGTGLTPLRGEGVGMTLEEVAELGGMKDIKCEHMHGIDITTPARTQNSPGYGTGLTPINEGWGTSFSPTGLLDNDALMPYAKGYHGVGLTPLKQGITDHSLADWSPSTFAQEMSAPNMSPIRTEHDF